MGGINFDWIKKPPGILRFIAFVISIAIIALDYHYANGISRSGKLLLAVAAGDFFVLFFFVVSYLASESDAGMTFITGLCFDIGLGILNLVAGAVILAEYSEGGQQNNSADVFLAVGILHLVFTVVLIIDAILVIKDKI